MTIRKIALAVWLAGAWATLACVSSAQNDTLRMEQVVQFYVSHKQFMGSVLVARDKTVLFEKGFGSANLEWDIPN